MGCWDVFCFICGNSCHEMLNNYIEDIKNTIEMVNLSSSYSKFTKNYYTKLKESKNIINDLIELEKNSKWMKKCSMLLTNDKIEHNMNEVSCNITFCNKNICANHMDKHINECGFVNEGKCGVFIHTDCWKFIKKNYNIELKFSNLPKIKLLNSKEKKKISYTEWHKIFDINYGDIEKYWMQDFDFAMLVADNKKHLCSSPLKNDKNISQIKKNFLALKIKNDTDRKGPSSSATFYDNGDIKLGNNKYFWIKKNNKWIQINDKPTKIKIEFDINKINKKQLKYLFTIPLIGQSNINPVFILSSIIKKNIYQLELLLLESYRENIKLTT